MIQIRRSQDRGPSDLGWLQSSHTFSFGSYYDKNFMGVSCLRVINDDKVIPGGGFATHSHQDMEIISYVKKGVIEHKDSMGNIETLPAGEFQLMSAGSGVTHSEYNPSDTEGLEFLQIWIQPNVNGIEPAYQQKHFETQSGLQLIASNDAKDGSLLLHQDASLFELRLDTNQSIDYKLENNRIVYVHLVTGKIEISGEVLNHGDGATIKNTHEIKFRGLENSHALLFDLP